MLMSRMLTSRPMGRNSIYPHPHLETESDMKKMDGAAAAAPAPNDTINNKYASPRGESA